MESWPSIWFLIRSWLTPAVLFLLLNLVIGTIAITSKTLLSHIHHPHAGEAENHGIARTAIHRLRSLSLMRLRSGDLFFDSSISAAVGQQKSDEISEVELDKKRVLEPEGEEKRLLEPEGEEKRVLEKEGEEKRLLEKEGEGVVVEEVVEDGVDARADDFINRFRQQLHLQRLDSLLKYKDMLSGGGR